MNKILCLLALCALWDGYCLAAVGGEDWAADIYIDGESKGYDSYEGSALYDEVEGSGKEVYPDVDSESEETEEGSAVGAVSDCEVLLQRVQRQNLLGAYEPRCTATGEFEAMQCSASTGECWCVNYDGETIPGTRDKSPWSPECKDVDRTRPYPKIPVIEKKPKEDVGVEPPKSGEDGSEEIVTDGDNMHPESDVDIGHAETEGDNSEEGADNYDGTPEKLERKGLLGQPLILAGLIAIAVVCLLCAVLLVMFIVYRMRKKDEGSYALDEPKRSPSHPYQRAPTREYFA